MALILIAIVALTGGMFASGHTTPRLGIDLAGGTSITLQAKNEPGQKNAINPTNMNTAVDIMNRRVNGLGVTEAEVQTQGESNIIVNIPKGTNSEQAREQVGTTAKLYFRPVLTTEVSGGDAPASPSPSPSSSASAGSDKGSDKDKATDKATSSSLRAPSATATSQGRAVTDALKADPTPSGSGSPLLGPGSHAVRERRPGDRQAPGAVRRTRLHQEDGPRDGRRRCQGRGPDRGLRSGRPGPVAEVHPRPGRGRGH